MKNGTEKKADDRIIWYILVIVVVGIQIFLPKQGKFVLIDEAFRISIVWIVGLYIVLNIKKAFSSNIKTHQAIKVLVMITSMVVCLFFTKNIMKDVCNGTDVIGIENIGTVNYQGLKGTLIKHYYVMGTDEEGGKRRLEISADEYAKLSLGLRNQIRVEYYPNTQRVVTVF